MRALLIVNPYATSTTAVRREVITHALASELDLDVVQTRYRGHASHVAEGAARDGFGLLLTLGGDGTVNEVVNGILRACPPAGIPAAPAPLLAALPGGSANVFTRALGLSADPAAVLDRVDVPVALLDGAPATPHRWASLLCERLDPHLG